MTGARVLLCGVCAASLRVDARFCSRCGVEQGTMVPRDGGAGPLREPSRPAGARPHIGGQGLIVALAAYFAMLVPLAALIAGGFGSLSDMLWAELWIGGVAVVGLAVMWRDTLPLLRPRLASITARQVGVASGVIALALGVVWVEAWLFSGFYVDATLPYRLEGKGLAFALLHAAVVPAIVEELAFRGVVLTALTGMFRERTALLMSSMMFAILHLSPLAFVHLTLLGVLCGAARLRTGSVWPAVAIHLAYNAAVIALGW